jgi:hypothetical protein
MPGQLVLHKILKSVTLSFSWWVRHTQMQKLSLFWIKECETRNITERKRCPADTKLYNNYFLCYLMPLSFSSSSQWVPYCFCGEVMYGTECYECNVGLKVRSKLIWDHKSACRAPSALNVFDDVIATGMSFIWRKQRHVSSLNPKQNCTQYLGRLLNYCRHLLLYNFNSVHFTDVSAVILWNYEQKMYWP